MHESIRKLLAVNLVEPIEGMDGVFVRPLTRSEVRRVQEAAKNKTIADQDAADSALVAIMACDATGAPLLSAEEADGLAHWVRQRILEEGLKVSRIDTEPEARAEEAEKN